VRRFDKHALLSLSRGLLGVADIARIRGVVGDQERQAQTLVAHRELAAPLPSGDLRERTSSTLTAEPVVERTGIVMRQRRFLEFATPSSARRERASTGAETIRAQLNVPPVLTKPKE